MCQLGETLTHLMHILYNIIPCLIQPTTYDTNAYFASSKEFSKQLNSQMGVGVGTKHQWWLIIGIDHDTVCTGVVGTAIRNTTSCAGRHNECWKRAVVWLWLVLELSTVLALTQLGIRQSDWWRAGIRSTNLHIVVELSIRDSSAYAKSTLVTFCEWKHQTFIRISAEYDTIWSYWV